MPEPKGLSAKIFALALVLIFAGIIALYVWIGRLGGGEQLQQDKALAAGIQGREALSQKRPDLALKYFDKGLKVLGDGTPQRGPLLAGKADALLALGRCPDARTAWSEACRLGQLEACKRKCP